MINNSITYSLISTKIHTFYRSFIEPLIGLWHNQGWIVFRRYEKSTALPTCWSWVGLSGYLLFIFINSSEWRTMVTDMSPSVQEMGGEEEYLPIINSCLKAINHQAFRSSKSENQTYHSIRAQKIKVCCQVQSFASRNNLCTFTKEVAFGCWRVWTFHHSSRLYPQ